MEFFSFLNSYDTFFSHSYIFWPEELKNDDW